MSRGTFTKVGKSAESLYGPRAVLVCGFAADEQKTVMDLLAGIQDVNVPVIFAASRDGEAPLKDLLARPDQSGRDADSDLARAVVLAGITEDELHRILSAYRGCGLPRPLWATLTPFSENWSLSALLQELEAERSFENKGKS